MGILPPRKNGGETRRPSKIFQVAAANLKESQAAAKSRQFPSKEKPAFYPLVYWLYQTFCIR
jgi:hypothetical protein